MFITLSLIPPPSFAGSPLAAGRTTPPPGQPSPGLAIFLVVQVDRKKQRRDVSDCAIHQRWTTSDASRRRPRDYKVVIRTG
uniref:Predicted protein n=1 Tax=Hordeum vulgare subsp. vulgare TaxID=112509 RepID=F2CYL5_HORVV|nr:predicted protein [Hordeum vulgare subsp. vulgare]